uniref:Putative secreted protein n=1 Tax=Panstrongylus lignarius TaxID=156445 RepID=A0A224XSB7_9HEMI
MATLQATFFLSAVGAAATKWSQASLYCPSGSHGLPNIRSLSSLANMSVHSRCLWWVGGTAGTSGHAFSTFQELQNCAASVPTVP